MKEVPEKPVVVQTSQEAHELDNDSENLVTANTVSSFIESFYWVDSDEYDHGLLKISISGKKYIYKDVPRSKYDELYEISLNPSSDGSSIGKYFQKKIKNKGYDYEKLE